MSLLTNTQKKGDQKLSLCCLIILVPVSIFFKSSNCEEKKCPKSTLLVISHQGRHSFSTKSCQTVIWLIYCNFFFKKCVWQEENNTFKGFILLIFRLPVFCLTQIFQCSFSQFWQIQTSIFQKTFNMI